MRLLFHPGLHFCVTSRDEHIRAEFRTKKREVIGRKDAPRRIKISCWMQACDNTVSQSTFSIELCKSILYFTVVHAMQCNAMQCKEGLNMSNTDTKSRVMSKLKEKNDTERQIIS